MKRYVYRTALLLMSIAPKVHSQDHAFTVRDDIEMVHFSDPSALHKDELAKFSPNGKYFAVVTSRGIIASDEIESILSVFDAQAADAFVAASDSATAPLPRTATRMAA